MTNTVAISLGLLIVVAIGLDLWLDLGMGVYLARRFVDLLGYVAFWR